MPPTDRFIYEYLDRGEAFAFSADYGPGLELLAMHEEIRATRLL